MTKIVKCTCEHKFQDKQYGKGNRLANQITRDKMPMWRCTVCQREHS